MFLNLLFIVSAILTIGAAVMVLVTKNIMHACVYLLGSLIGVAGLYATMGADFVAVTQLMVYVGGVVILMVFAVMLTGGKDHQSKTQKLLELIPNMGNKWSYIVGGLTALVITFVTFNIVRESSSLKINERVGFKSTVDEIGFSLISDHALAFEISSVLLVGALVGAAIIARPRKERQK